MILMMLVLIFGAGIDCVGAGLVDSLGRPVNCEFQELINIIFQQTVFEFKKYIFNRVIAICLYYQYLNISYLLYKYLVGRQKDSHHQIP